MDTIIWLRDDLRLADNQALSFAAQQGAVLPIYILSKGLGGASHWWLHHSLQSLIDSLLEYSVSLLLLQGEPSQVLLNLAKQTGINQVVWNDVYSPQGMSDGNTVKQILNKNGVSTQSFNSQLLIDPSKVLNKQGLPFKVFTPFWKHCQNEIDNQPPLPIPALAAVDQQTYSKINTQTLPDWLLLPSKPEWSAGLQQRWQPGESNAHDRWQRFLGDGIKFYKEGRDFPSQDNTSYLSPHLAFGEISARQCWYDVQQGMVVGDIDQVNGHKFLAEIGWREFSRYLLVHFSHITESSFNARFDQFPWQFDQQLLKAWQQGQTGYPIVDAGMRELWHTGYMHNRVRMVVASFLCKHCLIHWQHGMDWFWDTLVDADIANNTASWQWVAGCGADAAPYFRIFNPILQGEKFDSKGDYVRRWVPELNAMPARFIHKPWQASPTELQAANVRLADNYPMPIVDHFQARNRALEAYNAIKK